MQDPLVHYTVLGFVFLAGLCVGSFLNVIIHRMPLEESIVRPGSRCPHCKTPLRWRDNIPLFSFLFLRGRCAHCGAKISKRYPVVEFLTGALFLAGALKEPDYLAWPFHFYFLSTLVACTFIDLDHWILPDKLTLPGIAVGLLGALILPETRFLPSLVGALLGGGLLLLIAWLYSLFTKKEGLGGGDIKFLAMVGAFLGPQGALVTMVLSSMIGSVFGLVLILFFGKGGKTAIPFGPFLAGGALCAFLFGQELWLWYFHSNAALP